VILLLDASVWLAAVQADDPTHAPARELVLDPAAAVAALDLTLYEVANVVARAWNEPARAEPLARFVFTRARHRLRSVDLSLLAAAARLVDANRISLYDAAYAAAADAEGWRLVSGDDRDLVRPGLAITPQQGLDLVRSSAGRRRQSGR